VTPTIGLVAPKISDDVVPRNNNGRGGGEANQTLVAEIMRFMFPANLVGLPAITYPITYVRDGDERELPVGFQVMGKWWEEDVLLAIAAVGESISKKQEPAQYYPTF